MNNKKKIFFFFLSSKVLKVWRPGRKTSGFRTVRILKICQTSGPDVMSSRALLRTYCLLFILWWNRFVKPTFKMRSISFSLLLESEKKFEHWTVHLWRWIWGHEFRSTSFSFGCQPTHNVLRLFVEYIAFS